MRILPLVTALMLSVAAVPALATNVVVLDTDAAIKSTDLARKTIEKLNADTKPQRDRADALRKELSDLQEKFQKNASIMSDKEKQEMEKQYQIKMYELNGLGEAMQKRNVEMTQELLKKVAGTLQNVVESVRTANKYDIILDRKSAHMVDPSSDITKDVADKLNAALNAAGLTDAVAPAATEAAANKPTGGKPAAGKKK